MCVCVFILLFFTCPTNDSIVHSYAYQTNFSTDHGGIILWLFFFRKEKDSSSKPNARLTWLLLWWRCAVSSGDDDATVYYYELDWVSFYLPLKFFLDPPVNLIWRQISINGILLLPSLTSASQHCFNLPAIILFCRVLGGICVGVAYRTVHEEENTHIIIFCASAKLLKLICPTYVF